MAETDVLCLPAQAPGTVRHLKLHRFGNKGARPKVYVHAAMHADELPACLVAHHLVERLRKADENGEIAGEIIVVPVANPIGLDSLWLGDHQGRFHATSGQNFNRGWPRVAEQVVDRLSNSPPAAGEAQHAIHQAIRETLAFVEPSGEADVLRLTLMSLACDADIVLDLHTDAEAELHLYVDPDQWPGASDLAALLDAKVVMLARASGNAPFEETVAEPYLAMRSASGLAEALPLPLTAVVELRGERDASDALAATDSAALFRFLVHRGAISGGPVEVPAYSGIAAPFAATDILEAPAPGIVVFAKELGDAVARDDVVAEILDPYHEGKAARVPVRSRTDGRLFTRTNNRLAWPGAAIAKVQGSVPLSDRIEGALLYD